MLQIKKSSHGRGVDLYLQEGDVLREKVEEIMKVTTKLVFAKKGLPVPKMINVAKFISNEPLVEGCSIVKPFVVEGIHVPLFIKATDSPAKILVAPLYGLCPEVVKDMIREIAPEPLIPQMMLNSQPTPFGTYPQSSH